MAGAARPLSDKQKAFVREYLVSLNASDAYRKAGYRAKDANVAGPRLLADVRIAEAIAKQTKDRFDRLGIDADALLKRAETILKADARELTSYHVGACRYCFGIDHLFQWKTEREFRETHLAAKLKLPKKPTADQIAALPTDEGGFGYRVNREPNPNCPECGGEGRPYAVFADTRKLSEAAAILFEGVKEGKDGLEFKMASKQAAMDLLAKHHGLLVNKHEVTGKDGKPIQHEVKARVVVVPPKIESPTETRQMPKDDGGDQP